MAKIYLGTMGFSYDDWQGGFYPPGMPARNYLAHYQKFFNAVEIDSTFYGTPRRQTVLGWAGRVAEDFRFALKAPQVITHQRGLVGAEEEMLAFLRAVEPLGERLGVILVQLPPSFDSSQLPALAEFSAWLPPEFSYAVELRHPSWYPSGEPEAVPVAKVLSQHGIAWAITEYPGLPNLVTMTAGHLYIRWIGEHGRYSNHRHEQVDLSPQLRDWWQSLQPALDSAERLYGFFNNDYAGHAPATCNKFKAIAGLEAQEPSPPRQGTLW